MRLPKLLLVSRAGPLLTQLELPLAAGETLTLDGGAVERVDAAGLQLLLFISRELRRRGGALRWSAASLALRDAARLLGLEAELTLTEADAAHDEATQTS